MALDTLRKFVTAVSVVFWIGVMVYAHWRPITEAHYGVLFFGSVVLIYLLYELAETGDEGGWLNLAVLGSCGIITLVTIGYISANFTELYIDRVGYAYTYEYALAAIFIGVILYLTWREYGMTFLAIVGAGILYGLFGSAIPGILGHGGISPNRLLLLLILDIEGFFGFLTRLTATWIALFLLLAGLFQGYGAFNLILRFAIRSAKYIESGVAQTAVIASMIIGSINGSQTANAGMTGSITIPVMKENGISSETSAGIEAVASTSGQVLPPVMGAAAFIMASLLGIQYIDVIIAGLLPAFILCVAIVVAVHYVAVSEIDSTNIDIDKYIDGEMATGALVLECLKFSAPVLVLIYLLGVVQWTVITSALYSVLTMVFLGVAVPTTQALGGYTDTTLREQLRIGVSETIDGFRLGAIVAAPIALILGAINGVIDILLASGVPSAVTLALLEISGGVMLIAIIISMVICIVLGLGMQTSAAYLIVALLIAPTLIDQFAVPELAAHYFVFYAAILAGITPPVATTAAVAAGIAGGNFWGASFMSVKIAAPLFFLPFSFIYHPELVSAEFTFGTFTTAAVVLVGALALIHGLNYPFKFVRRVKWPARALYVVLGISAMVLPSQMLQMGAAAAIIFLYVVQSIVLDNLSESFAVGAKGS